MSPAPAPSPAGLRGRWRDERMDERGHVLCAGTWRSNRVVDGSSRLLAALMKGEPGVGGLRYWAFGTGEDGWDALLPGPRPGDTRLAGEVARQALAPEQVIYLDAAGNPSDSATERLQVTTVLRGSDFGNGARLREFGLFGGDATGAADSGTLVNRVIHPRIDLGPGDTLRRTLHLTFSGGAPGADGASEPAAAGVAPALPVESLDGVGRVYAGMLAAAGIGTVRQLADADPFRSVANIPQAKLRELRAKARIVVELHPAPALLAPLAGRSLGSLLAARPEDLAGAVGGIGRATQTAAYLQRYLAPLEIALDSAWLHKLRVEDLVPL